MTRRRGRRPAVAGAWWSAVLVAGASILMLGPATQAGAQSSAPSGWSAQAAPSPSGAPSNPQEKLSSVSCGAVGSCAAVGWYVNASGDQLPVVASLASGTWSVAAAPLPNGVSPASGDSIALESVSCASPGSCVAVGWITTAAAGTEGLIETLASGTWSATVAPLPNDANGTWSQLWAVSCPTSGSCVSVGSYQPGSGGEEALAETLSSGTWVPAAIPLPANADQPEPTVSFGGISCPQPGSCVAVGLYDAPVSSGSVVSSQYDMSETLAQGSWTAATIPSSSPLYEVSCATAGSCTAVGFSYSNSASGTQVVNVVETLSSGAWTEGTVPSPANASGASAASGLYGISCDPTCVAVGTYHDVNGYNQGFDAVLDSGGQWTSTQLADPGTAGSESNVQVRSVDCLPYASAGATVLWCVAGGNYGDASGDIFGLTEQTSIPPSATTVSAPSGSVTSGQPTTLTATVDPDDGGGTVTFSSGNSGISGCTGMALSDVNGTYQASCTTSSLPEGNDTVTATYSGDSGFSSSSGNTVVQVSAPPPVPSPSSGPSSAPPATSSSSPVPGIVNTVAVVGPSNTLWIYWETPDAQWHGPYQVGAPGSTYSEPAMVAGPGGLPDIVTQGPNDALYLYWETADAQWHGPLGVGTWGSTFSAPAIRAGPDGLPYVVAEGPNRSLYLYWETADAQWHGPYGVGAYGSTYSAPSLASSTNGLPDVVAEGPGNSLYLYWETADAQWHGPYGVGAYGSTFSSPSIVIGSNGLPDIASEGPNNSLYLYWQTPDAQWHGPLGPGAAGSTFAAPAMGVGSNGLPTVATLGPGGQVWVYWEAANAQWYGPLGVGGPSTTGSPPALIVDQ